MKIDLLNRFVRDKILFSYIIPQPSVEAVAEDHSKYIQAAQVSLCLHFESLPLHLHVSSSDSPQPSLRIQSLRSRLASLQSRKAARFASSW